MIVEVARVWDEEGAKARAAQGDPAAWVTVSETAEGQTKGAIGRIQQHGRAITIRNGGARATIGAIRPGGRSRRNVSNSACPTSKARLMQ